MPLCLVYFDLNDFKKLNDTHGHVAGDKVLMALGAATLDAVRTVDIPCRYGGDEFCIIMPRTEVSEAKIACERLIKYFSARCNFDISMSIGIAQTGPDHTVEAEELVRQADAMMYEAKQKSKQASGSHVVGRRLKRATAIAAAG